MAKRLDMRSKYVPNKDIMFSTSSFRSLHRKNKRKTKSRGPRFFRAAVAAVLSQLKIRAFYLLYEVKAEKKKEGPLLRGTTRRAFLTPFGITRAGSCHCFK